MKITYSVYLSTIHFYTVCFLLLEISKHGVVFTMKCMSSGSSSAQTIHPSSKLAHKRHIFGMSTSLQNDFYCPKLCRLNCTLKTSTPPKILLHRAVFWRFAKPLHGNSEISHGCMLQHTNSCLLFQT